MPKLLIRCIIIEDEPHAANVLEHHIARCPSLQLTGSFRSVAAAGPLADADAVDLIFLDINLPGMSGIAFATRASPAPAIIFTTAYPQYALEGFDVGAVDYLLKPISFDRFSRGISKYLRQHPTTEKRPGEKRQAIFVTCERALQKIYLDEILYLEAQRNALLIHTRQEAYKTYHAIAEMEEKLPTGLFLRVHRSFLVPLSKVERFSSTSLTIEQKEVPIGRLFRSAVLTALKNNREGL